YDDGTFLGAASLDVAGIASLDAVFQSGVHGITADYTGDVVFDGNSASLGEIVLQDATTAALATSDNPAVSGQTVTLTDTVTADFPGSGTPTGYVDFYADGS